MYTNRTLLKKVLPLVVISLLSVGGAFAQEFNFGDVLVAVTGGYKIYDKAGSLKGTITLPSCTTCQAAGPAIDSTYHPLGTDFTDNTVVRYAIGDPHPVLQNIPIVAASGNVTSAVFDGRGRFYVAVSGNAHALLRYVYDSTIPGYKKDSSFNVTVPEKNGISTGPTWIDISSDGSTVYYTSLDRTIRTFNVNTDASGDFIPTNYFPGSTTLYGLRLLPNTGLGALNDGLLVASGDSVHRFRSDGTELSACTISGEADLETLALDTDGTSFWVGNPTSGNFYKVGITSCDQQLGPFTAGSGGPSGLAVWGAFSLAQGPAFDPTPASATLTSSTPSASFHYSDGSATNKLTLTLENITDDVHATVRVSAVDPRAGFSDGGLPCTPTAAIDAHGKATKCVVWQKDLDTILAPGSALNEDESVVAATGNYPISSEASSLTDYNTRLLHNESEDITDGVRAFDPFGSSCCRSIFSLNQVGGTDGGCYYLSPLSGPLSSQPFPINPSRNNVTFKIQCANLPAGDSIDQLHPYISLSVVRSPGEAPQPIIGFTPTGGTPTGDECYRNNGGNSWVLNWDTTNYSGKTIVATTFFGNTDVCGGAPLNTPISPIDVEFSLTTNNP